MLQEMMDFAAANLFAVPCIDALVLSSRFTAVHLDSRDTGMAANALTCSGSDLPGAESLLQGLIGQPALEVARAHVSSPDQRVASLGMAALNALSQPYLEFKYLQAHGIILVPWEEELGPAREVEEGSDRVVMVGYSEWLPAVAARCRQLELYCPGPEYYPPRLHDYRGALRGPLGVASCAEEPTRQQVQGADAVLVNCDAVLPSRLPALLDRLEGQRVVLYGVGAALFPLTLFRWGVSTVYTWKALKQARVVEWLANSGPDAASRLATVARPVQVKRVGGA
ncbi:MAG: DUF4213 domain-containing proteins [Syntrophomonadaceae bacterium]|jgi:uncharacterized protein (DUF4213/DUF364 family)|nr:DUF4213 domain-containing proteins [Syntrophomonadaceae bacterium]